jgi:hypothetical protein
MPVPFNLIPNPSSIFQSIKNITMNLFKKTNESNDTGKNEFYDLDKAKNDDQENSLTYTVLINFCLSYMHTIFLLNFLESNAANH